MSRTLIKFTTRIINEGILSEYKKYQNINGYDTTLMLDNSENKFLSDTQNCIQEFKFYGEKYKCFLFDINLHDAIKN